LVGDAVIRDLNKKYLNKDRPTDVLAFRMQDGDFRDLNPQLLGDIVVSVETATRRSRNLKTSFEYELYLYLAHGLLHLLGYTDMTKKGAQKMQRIQKELLKDYA